MIVASRSGGRSRRRVAPGSNSGSGTSTSISSSVSPRVTRAPDDTTTTADSRAPSTKVPLVDPRSSSSTPSSCGRTARWRRETSSSWTVRSAFSRPTTSSPTSSMRSPERGPDRTIRKGMRATLTGTPARAHCN